MLELPPELQAWAEPLALFDEDVPHLLGRWLLPLRSIVGPMSVPHSATSGEPDGYAGLARRGPYDRLLLSEWAVALEIPEEFLRRAVMKEHVFLAPAYVEPRGASTCVALLDVGPLQLGTPRLVHLAALIVLRQRAEDAGAAFRFGVLQDASTHLRELDRRAIPAWIKARSWADADVGRGWEETLAELEPEDLWLVGDVSLLSAANRLGAGLLEVDELLGTTPARVRVQAHHRSSVGGAVELQLPESDACIRILRRPLAPPRRRRLDPGELSLPAGARVSRDGRRLFVRRRDGGILGLHVPNSRADRRGRSKTLDPIYGRTMVAVDQLGRRLIALEIDREGLLCLRGAGFGSFADRSAAHSVGGVNRTMLEVPPSLVLHDPDRPSLATFHVTRADANRFEAWILGLNGELWTLTLARHQEPKLTLMDRACLRFCRLRTDLLAWVSGSEQTVLSSAGRVEDGLLLTEAELATVSFAPSHNRAVSFAYTHEPQRTCVVNRLGLEGTENFVTRPGTVIGFEARHRHESPQFIVLDPDRRALHRDAEALLESPTRLSDVVYEPCCGRIVARDERGAITVYSIGRGGVLLSVDPGEGGG